MITMIAAAAENNELGKDNQLLWHLPDDFKRFKALTTAHHIIMGRKTFESFPKPLPHRTHIVITRQKDYSSEGCIVVHTIEDAITTALRADKHPFIIGGGEIYKLGLPYSQQIELTRVHASFPQADAFFPEIKLEEWELIQSTPHSEDERHKYPFTYLTYRRK
ncbi:dihydrofolate reductase [Sinomicrobium sp.]